jgi:hypothetical protein
MNVELTHLAINGFVLDIYWVRCGINDYYVRS